MACLISQQVSSLGSVHQYDVRNGPHAFTRSEATKGVKKAPAAFQVTSRDGGPDDLEGILGLLVGRTWIQCACFGDRSIVASYISCI